MQTVGTARDLSQTEWLDLAKPYRDQSFEQSFGYALAAANRIGARLRLMSVVCGRDQALVALRVKAVPGFSRGIAWCPAGPMFLHCADVPEDVEAILSTLRHKVVEVEGNILRLRFAPASAHLAEPALLARANYAAKPNWADYRSFMLNLTFSESDLMDRLHGKWRTDLRYALKSGLEVDHFSTQTGPLSDVVQQRFLALYRTVQEAKGFHPDITPEFHFRIAERGASDYVINVFIVKASGQDVAGIVTCSAGATGTYLFGATTDAGRPVRAGYLLQWRAIAEARQQGCLWYDLGGIDFEANPDVARFKERMGGTAIEAFTYQAQPSGAFPLIVQGLERLRNRLKGRSA